VLPGLKIEADRLCVRLNPQSIDFDFNIARACLKAGDLEGAIAVYHQPFLSSYTAWGSDFFIEWAHEQRSKLHAQFCSSIKEHLAYLDHKGEWERCAALARQLLARPNLELDYDDLKKWIAQSPKGRGSLALPDISPGRSSRGILLSREGELRSLQQNLVRAATAGPAVALITGDPGIGKSHLVRHFLRLAALKGAKIIEARATRPDRRQAYSVLLRGIAEGANTTTRERLAALSPHIADVLSSRVGRTTGYIRHDVNDSLLYAFESIANDSLLTLFIDDYQWCDGATRTLCERLLNDLTNVPVQLILAARSSLEDPFSEFRMPRYSAKKTEIHLDPLNEVDSKRLAREIAQLNGFDLPDSAAQVVYRRTGGNPFYIIEVVGHLRKGTTVESIGSVLPHSVKSSIVGRAQELSRSDRAVLARLAVVGKGISNVTLRELLSGRSMPSLGRLRASGLITCTEDMISFSHDLIREAVYQKIPSRIRRALHQRYALLLMEEDASAAEIFWHLKQAGDDKGAAAHVRLAAQQADQIKAYRDAEYFFKLAVEYAETPNEKTAALERLALFYMRTRQPHSAELVWKTLVNSSTDDRRSRAYLAWKVAALISADQRAAVDISIILDEIEQVVRVARENGFRESFVPAMYLLGELALDLGRSDFLQSVLTVVHESMIQSEDQESADELALLEAQLLSYSGRQNEALRLIQRHQPREKQSVLFHARWLAAKAVLLMNAGRAQESVRCYEEVAELAKDAAPELWNAQINNYGLVLWECGRYEDARQLWLKDLEEERPASTARHVYIHVNLSFLYHDTRDLRAAQAHAKIALTLNESRSSKSVVANARAVIGLCALEMGSRAEATACFEDLLKLVPDVSCGFSDSTYPEIFITRYLSLSEPKRALARLDEAIEWYAGRSAASRQTLRLERARLTCVNDLHGALAEIADVEEWAIRAGAFAVADQAQLCRREVRIAVQKGSYTGDHSKYVRMS